MRKTDRLIAAVIVLAMALTFVFTGCTNAAPDMKISIDGKGFELGCKVSDIIDAGLELASIDSASHIITEYPELEARTLLQNSLFIYKNGESSHVAIYVMNKTVNAMTLNECIVYAFKYDCGTFSGNASRTPGIKVLFNGIDFRFTERQTVLTSLESRGFRFKDADKQEFLKSGDAYSTSLISVTNSNGSVMTVYNDYDFNTGDMSARTMNLTGTAFIYNKYFYCVLLFSLMG